MEWKNLRGNTDGLWMEGALVPAYRLSDREIVLIDSGARREPELLPELEARGLRVRAILCTHLHPDHIFNNADIVDRDEAEIFASREELEDYGESLTRLADAAAQFGMEYPRPAGPVTAIEPGTREVIIAGAAFAVIPTPGHTRGHLSFVTPDGVCCLGDAVLTPDRLASSRLPYFEYLDPALDTMEALRGTEFTLYLAAHEGAIPREGLEELVEVNIRKELELYEVLRAVITGPMEPEDAVTRFMEGLGLRPRAVGSGLLRHTARARLAALVNAGEYRLEDGRIVPN